MDMYGAGELERVREESVRQLDGGGLPVLAERRLAALSGAGAGRFTSNLSVAGLTLARPAGLRPIAQVMGACVYHEQHATNNVRAASGEPGNAYRMPGTSGVWNASRDKALDRLAAEARLCGADAVVGVSVRQTQQHLSSAYAASVECVATGTAVACGRPAAGTPGPVLTSLSVQDYWKLLQQGHAAVGLAASTMVIACKPSPTTVRADRATFPWSRARRQAREIPEFSKALLVAHRMAFQEMHDQAARLGATGIVGVSIKREQHTVQPRNARLPVQQRIVVVHALGTAIIPSALFGTATTPGTAPPAHGGPLTLTPVRHVNEKSGAAR